jgi:hypothetical protein
MNYLKWAISWATAIFLFSVVVAYWQGASLIYALASGGLVIISIVALLSLFALPIAVELWLISKMTPQGETPSCLPEAIWLRGVVVWEKFKRR